MRTTERVYSYDVELLPDGTVNFLRIDDALQELWGYSVDELRNGALAQLTATQEERLAEIIELCRMGRSSTTRMRMISKDGTPRVYVIHREPEMLEDRVIVRAVARDITDVAISDARVQEREARLRLLAEHIPLTMWSTDENLAVTWWSGSGPSQVDLSHELTVHDFFGEPSLGGAVGDASKRALKGETVTFDHVWHEHAFRFSVESSHDEVGDVNGTIGVAIDLSGLNSQRPIPLAVDIAGAVQTSVQPLQEENYPEAIVVGDLWIDPEGYVVRRKGEEVSLTITEFKLLLQFARKPGKVLSQRELALRVWGSEFLGSQSNIPMAIKRLRAKIEEDPSDPQIIETVRGVGYRMHKPEA